MAIESVESSRQMLKRGRYLLNTDGGVKNNGHNAPGTLQGDAAKGVVLSDPGDRVVTTHSSRIGVESVPGTEYRALIAGLEIALELGIEKIRAFVDNQLVVDQINQTARVRKPYLEDLHAQTIELLERFPDNRVYWVPRERNREADALVRDALYRNGTD